MQFSLFDKPPEPDEPLTVSEFNRHVRDLLESAPVLRGVTVQGEVSNMARAQSGHWYFSIKDDKSQLRCVMWRSANQRQGFTPQDGDEVEVTGRVTVYEPRGEYQLQAERVRPRGVGDLYARFEELKARLSAEGLFDDARKRPLHPFPLRIGIVTSPTTAALQDVLNVLRRRFPLAEVVLSPTLVQGADAPPQIVRALQRIDAYGAVDVVLLVRGGGSIEDLWCFNDEQVARAVARMSIPVVSGVGHEIDFTIVDFVADLRAPTPSAAAELATPHIDAVHEAVRTRFADLLSLTRDRLATCRDDLDDYQRTLDYLSPEGHIRTMRQSIDRLQHRAVTAQANRHALLKERLRARHAALQAANPQAILRRGYAIIRRPDGTQISGVGAVSPGDALHVRLADGTLNVRVQDATPDPSTATATATD